MNQKKTEEITKERSVKIFVASLKSPKTKEDYLRNLERFRKYAKFVEFDDFVLRNPKDIQRLVEDYVLKMREDEHPNTIPMHYYPIQSFLEMNDVSINFKKIRRLFPGKIKTAVERGWSTDEVQKMLSVTTDLRTRALILFENASGGRIGLFDELQIKHLHEIDDETYGKCYSITGYAESTEEYVTFLTPEATKALDDYLEYRKSKGHLLSSDDFVFTGKKMISGNSFTSSKNLGSSVVYVAKKAGLRNPLTKKGSRYPVPTNHGFRHRFNEILKTSNLVNPHIAEKFLSHKSRLIPLDSVYFSPNIETMFAEYKKVIPLLTINPSENLLLKNQDLKSENLKLKEIQTTSENQALEIEKLTKMVEIIQKTREISN